MLFKQLSIPLDDLRLQKPDIFNRYTSHMECDLNSSASQEMFSSGNSEEENYDEKEVKSVKKLVKIVSSDSEEEKRKIRPRKETRNTKKEARKPNSDTRFSKKNEEITDDEESDESPSSEEDSEAEDADFDQKEVKRKRTLRRATRNTKKQVKKNSDSQYAKKEEEITDSEGSDESPSSEDDNMDKDPDFDQKKEESEGREIKNAKEKAKINKSDTRFVVKKEPKSAYEQMIEKNRLEKLAFLESLKIDEVKASLSEVVNNSGTKRKVQTFKRKYPKKEKPTSPPVLRKSRRLANVSMDLSEDALYYDALKRTEDTVETPKKVIPPEMSFKEALESEDFYESYKAEVNIKESKPATEFTIYNKSVLSKMTVSESNIVKVTPARITALTWYPSPDHLVLAAGDKHGQVGIWNLESENPYVFKTHYEGITNLQFSPFNQTQLISSSYDGILRCGDIVQHNFSEIYNVSDETSCTYFDFLSATTYLVAQKNGQVALVDKRTEGKRCEKKHECHDYLIKTVNIHPTNRNFFVTAENKGSIRLWDLRKLQSTPVADIVHHKRCVHSAFFSPVTGNSILALSTDDSISIFDSKILSSDIKVRVQMKHNNQTGRWLSVFRATWLPNSDETFVVGSMLNNPRRIEVYDKNMFIYSTMMHDNLSTITSTNAFHPARPALAGGNSSGKVVVFL